MAERDIELLEVVNRWLFKYDNDSNFGVRELSAMVSERDQERDSKLADKVAWAIHDAGLPNSVDIYARMEIRAILAKAAVNAILESE